MTTDVHGSRPARQWLTWLVVAAAVGLAPGCQTSAPTVADSPSVAVTGDGGQAPGGPITVAAEKDGDSFVGSDGVEYRVGLVNTPERSECGGGAAARRAYELLAGGFTPLPYATDQYGRSVARIAVDDGDLGVILAAEGMADDRYLEDFRHEHPAYAEELDQAFAQARDRGAGLWASCWSDQPVGAPPATAVPVQPLLPPVTSGHGGRVGSWDCHPAYHECLPVGPDLDCGDVGHAVILLGEQDPYRLDGNDTIRTDGVGCETFEDWDGGQTYPYYG